MSQSAKDKLHRIIFEADTPAGRAFDVALILSISLSSFFIVLESVETIQVRYGPLLTLIELFFLLLFVVEFLLRLYIVPRRGHYIFSFFGMVDMFSILPGIAAFFFPAVRYLMVIRIFRLLRLFRVFKLVRYMEESSTLLRAIRASRPKITVFLLTIFFIVIFTGSLMYIVEGPENGFNNIPESMYWAIVTVSTVGYGDISPQTPLGKMLSALLMIVAYGIIAVPTGIITSELSNAARRKADGLPSCHHCGASDHSPRARYCHQCGEKLD